MCISSVHYTQLQYMRETCNISNYNSCIQGSYFNLSFLTKAACKSSQKSFHSWIQILTRCCSPLSKLTNFASSFLVIHKRLASLIIVCLYIYVFRQSYIPPPFELEYACSLSSLILHTLWVLISFILFTDDTFGTKLYLPYLNLQFANIFSKNCLRIL